MNALSSHPAAFKELLQEPGKEQAVGLLEKASGSHVPAALEGAIGEGMSPVSTSSATSRTGEAHAFPSELEEDVMQVEPAMQETEDTAAAPARPPPKEEPAKEAAEVAPSPQTNVGTAASANSVPEAPAAPAAAAMAEGTANPAPPLPPAATMEEMPTAEVVEAA
jgi:hypothetical protein